MLEFILNGPEIKNAICIEDNYMFLLKNKNVIIKKNSKKINLILIDHNIPENYINKLSMLCNIIAISNNTDVFKIVLSKYDYPHVGDTIKILGIQ